VIGRAPNHSTGRLLSPGAARDFLHSDAGSLGAAGNIGTTSGAVARVNRAHISTKTLSFVEERPDAFLARPMVRPTIRR